MHLPLLVALSVLQVGMFYSATTVNNSYTFLHCPPALCFWRMHFVGGVEKSLSHRGRCVSVMRHFYMTEANGFWPTVTAVFYGPCLFRCVLVVLYTWCFLGHKYTILAKSLVLETNSIQMSAVSRAVHCLHYQHCAPASDQERKEMSCLFCDFKVRSDLVNSKRVRINRVNHRDEWM